MSDLSDFLHLSPQEVISLADGKVVEMELWTWAEEHFVDCNFCRSMFETLKERIKSGKEGDRMQMLRWIYRKYRMAQLAKAIPFKRKGEKEK